MNCGDLCPSASSTVPSRGLPGEELRGLAAATVGLGRSLPGGVIGAGGSARSQPGTVEPPSPLPSGPCPRGRPLPGLGAIAVTPPEARPVPQELLDFCQEDTFIRRAKTFLHP